MLRAKSPRESRIVGNPPVRFDEGEGSVRTLSTLLLEMGETSERNRAGSHCGYALQIGRALRILTDTGCARAHQA
jgi:hypothetical protein